MSRESVVEKIKAALLLKGHPWLHTLLLVCFLAAALVAFQVVLHYGLRTVWAPLVVAAVFACLAYWRFSRLLEVVRSIRDYWALRNEGKL